MAAKLMARTWKIVVIRWSYNIGAHVILLSWTWTILYLLSAFFPHLNICICTLLTICCTGLFGTYCKEKNVFSFVAFRVGIVSDFIDVEKLLCHFHETDIRPSTFFEAEITHRIGTYKLLKSRYQEWKGRFKVDAVGSQYDSWMRRYDIWKRFAPV